jgi:hypothetical protein
VPIEQVKFFFNFDMVGRLDPVHPKLEIGYLGARSAEANLIDRHVPRNITLDHDLGIYLGASDHLSFATQKIPTAFYFTGIHGDYHRPTDTPDKINYAGEALIEDAALGAVLEIADSKVAPSFDIESTQWLFPQPAHVSKAAFGAQPGDDSDPRGLLLGESREGSSAAELGLRAGDVLVSFNNLPIKSLFDLNAAIGDCQAGERVKVQWIREGKTTEAEAVLKGR